MTYSEKLARRIAGSGSRLCVGLDPRLDRHDGPAGVRAFLEQVIDETAAHAACFKPNIAYFEAMGAEGYAMLADLVKRVPPGVPIILDAKRGDIGATQEAYAKAYFEVLGVDAVTLSPFMGFDSIEPCLRYEGKGVYLLAVTSNPGSADLQQLRSESGRHFYEYVGDFAARAAGLPGDVGFVVGLTNASGEVLDSLPDAPLLIPGLGAQGGDLEALAGAQKAAPNVINVSRGILYAEPEKSFTEKAQDYANRIASVLG
ncbi:MAG: orotidine-5'-phosphate decarboxylase [Verrucomicrobiales bacterium]